MVEVKNLLVRIQKNNILQSINCSILPHRIVSFIGESGAGKTTLLKSLVGLQSISSGTVTINNRNIQSIQPRERAELIGYVFQDFNLFRHLTVLENCIDPLIVHGIVHQHAKEKAFAQLKELGVYEHGNKYPHELSGGQQQRVALARSLCLNPKVLLLDEPTASLDPKNTNTLVAILRQLAAKGFAIGVSSQDMDFIRAIFDQIYYLENGKIIEFCDDIKIVAQTPAINNFITRSTKI